jgi:hypothetical protein
MENGGRMVAEYKKKFFKKKDPAKIKKLLKKQCKKYGMS